MADDVGWWAISTILQARKVDARLGLNAGEAISMAAQGAGQSTLGRVLASQAQSPGGSWSVSDDGGRRLAQQQASLPQLGAKECTEFRCDGFCPESTMPSSVAGVRAF
jgi:ABC-type polysaccharide/polyol phosphate transport system ATPase subunit